MPTKIEWTDETWNPLAGCTRVSPGCQHCYAERMAKRQIAMGNENYAGTVDKHGRWTGKINLIPEALEKPLRWRKPRRVFVNSMSDLFHEDVPFDYIDKVFAVMALCPQHTFQVLTKRPERMVEYLVDDADKYHPVFRRGHNPIGSRPSQIFHGNARNYRDHTNYPNLCVMINGNWPLPNVHLGVSVENQETAGERIPWLLKTPAAVRWVSYEPALGPVDFDGYLPGESSCLQCGYVGNRWDKEWCVECGKEYPAPTEHEEPHCECGCDDYRHSCPRCCEIEAFGVFGSEGFYDTPHTLDGIVVGCESGPGARPMDLDWVRSVRDQCVEARVAFFFKQKMVDGKKVGLPKLDGRIWDELPGQPVAQGVNDPHI